MLVKVERRARKDFAYSARMSIDNTDRAVLKDIQGSFGGALYEQDPRKAGGSRSYKLIWTRGEVERPLLLVVRHLHIKRSRARTLLHFIHRQRKVLAERSKAGSAPSPFRAVAYEEKLYRRMRELNAKGPPALPPGSDGATKEVQRKEDSRATLYRAPAFRPSGCPPTSRRSTTA